MLPLPPDMISLLLAFAPLFSPPIFPYVQILVVGAILAPGKRTVTAILRVMGLEQCRRFQNFHRVLNRARWSSYKAAGILLHLLVATFAPDGVVLLGIDEHLERRKGKKIAPKGIYRDAARSSKEYLTKASGLRWIVLMLLVPIPWAGRVWALPFLCVLAPSERYHQERKQRHKTLARWAGQMIRQASRWLSRRKLVVVADSAYAVLELLDQMIRLPRPVTMVTRLRLDAALYEPAGPREPGTIGRPRVKGKRLPTLETVADNPKTRWRRIRVPRWYSDGARSVEIVSETSVWYHAGKPGVPIRWVLIRDPRGQFDPQALLCTDPEATPEQIVAWFVQRWPLEVTFEEARAHLGIETQRQWNEQAIVRTTPALLGLFSIVTLLAHQVQERQGLSVRQAAWYQKKRPTFSDAIAAVRRELWEVAVFTTYPPKTDIQKLQQALFERFAETLCYAA
jgi:hypothetical protein